MEAEHSRLLIIEKDKARREALTQYLEQQGHVVATALDGRLGWEMVRADKYDLVLLDIDAPEMNGLQLLANMKGDAALRDIAVIMLLDHDDSERAVGAIEQGAADYLVAPYNASVVKARTAVHLEKSHLSEHHEDYMREKRILKMESELEIGRSIQAGFLPKMLPDFPGWEIAAYFHAARQVAGDFYDAFPLVQNRRLGLVIADVCDKGVGPAMYMALIRSMIRAFSQQHLSLRWADFLDEGGGSPSRRGADMRQRGLPSSGMSALKNAVELTNNYIAKTQSDDNMFATAFFAVLDPATGLLSYINGGHNPPAVINAQGEIKARLTPTGPAVGMLPDIDFGVKDVQMEPGDFLFTFTDGVTDARNPAGELFGEPRTLALLKDPPPTASDLTDRVVQSLRAHIDTADQFDDITMLCVRRVPLPPDA